MKSEPSQQWILRNAMLCTTADRQQYFRETSCEGLQIKPPQCEEREKTNKMQQLDVYY